MFRKYLEKVYLPFGKCSCIQFLIAFRAWPSLTAARIRIPHGTHVRNAPTTVWHSCLSREKGQMQHVTRMKFLRERSPVRVYAELEPSRVHVVGHCLHSAGKDGRVGNEFSCALVPPYGPAVVDIDVGVSCILQAELHHPVTHANRSRGQLIGTRETLCHCNRQHLGGNTLERWSQQWVQASATGNPRLRRPDQDMPCPQKQSSATNVLAKTSLLRTGLQQGLC